MISGRLAGLKVMGDTLELSQWGEEKTASPTVVYDAPSFTLPRDKGVWWPP